MLKSFKLVLMLLSIVVAPLTIYPLPSQIIIIRHGEKPLKGNELSAQGFERSNALRFYFQYDPFVSDFGIPKVIFASKPKKKNSSKRAIQTVTPYAEAFNIEINATFEADQIDELAHEIFTNSDYDGQSILISWKHSVIDQLCAALGVDPIPPSYPGSHYDLVYKITYPEDTIASAFFDIGLQGLMYDDRLTLPRRFSRYQFE